MKSRAIFKMSKNSSFLLTIKVFSFLPITNLNNSIVLVRVDIKWASKNSSSILQHCNSLKSHRAISYFQFLNYLVVVKMEKYNFIPRPYAEVSNVVSKIFGTPIRRGRLWFEIFSLLIIALHLLIVEC